VKPTILLYKITQKLKKKQNKLTTIELSEGNYSIQLDNNEDNQLHIEHPVTITGKGEKTVVNGGFWIKSTNVCVKNLTISNSTDNGVQGFASCTLTNINIKKCNHSGVVAIGNNANLVCENIVVSDCNLSGVLAEKGGTITLKGSNTLITKNCSGNIYSYGLKVSDEISKIKLKNLTKNISKDNYDGRNWFESKENQIIETTLKVSGENAKIKLENLTKDISKGNEGGRNWYESKENQIIETTLRF